MHKCNELVDLWPLQQFIVHKFRFLQSLTGNQMIFIYFSENRINKYIIHKYMKIYKNINHDLKNREPTNF